MTRYSFLLPYGISVTQSLGDFTKSPKALSFTVKVLASYHEAQDKENHENIFFFFFFPLGHRALPEVSFQEKLDTVRFTG